VTTTAADRPDVAAARRPTPTLLGLGVTAVAGLGLSVLYATTGLGVPCVFRAATGWDCPFCGGTRMGAALLHGDLATAWHFNPFALVGLGLATLLGGWLLVEQATGHRGALASRLSGLAGRLRIRFTTTTVTIAACALMVVWTVVRNVTLGPLP